MNLRTTLATLFLVFSVTRGDVPRADCCLVHTQNHAATRFCKLDVKTVTCGYEMTECSTWNKFGLSRSHTYLPSVLQTMLSKNKKCSRTFLDFKCSEQCGICDQKSRYLGACGSLYDQMLEDCAEFVANPVYGKYFVVNNASGVFPKEEKGNCVTVKGHRMMNTFSWGSLGVIVAFFAVAITLAILDKTVFVPRYAERESKGKHYGYKP